MIDPLTVKAVMQSQNEKRFLEIAALELGDLSQNERYYAGVLPEAELLGLARTSLFKPLDHFRRWRKLEIHHVRHNYSHDLTSDMVTFGTLPVATFSAQQWKIIKAFDSVIATASQHEWVLKFGGMFTMETREHTATCHICKASWKRCSVLVSVPWAGRRLSREYDLEMPR